MTEENNPGAGTPAVSEPRIRATFMSLPEYVGNHIAVIEYPSCEIIYLNPIAKTMLDIEEEINLIGQSWRQFVKSDKDLEHLNEGIEEAIRTGNWRGEVELTSLKQRKFPAKILVTCPPGSVVGSGVITIMGRDVTKEKQMLEAHKNMELQMNLMGKMDLLGRLAAGIAHEINTPAQYILNNLYFLKEQSEEVIKVFESLRDNLGENISFPEELQSQENFDLLKQDMKETIEQSIEGLASVKKLVHSLKEFSHPKRNEKESSPIEPVIRNAFDICRHEWVTLADVEFDFASDLPEIPCIVDQLNQVVLNLIINACHAIDEAIKQELIDGGLITAKIEPAENGVTVSIKDNGVGIPDDVLPKIFDNFFTTKESGVGTGQGLAIVKKVIEENHNGSLEVASKRGKGTTITFYLPF